tara:strand:- start:1144 stop:1977 length:834 start_codon:yes stop_codon:yes gene_type:complete
MQKVCNIIPFFLSSLSGIAPQREIRNWAYLSIEKIIGLNRSDTILKSNMILSSQIVLKLNDIVNELSNNQPIQYILSEVEFYGIKLKVNKNVLIPRPETEELVDWLLKDDFQSVLDIGTGSGCIAIALALNSNAIINAMDISKHALMVAQKNSINNRVKINFQNQDILKLNKLPKYDIIVSNPPYVLESYKSKISKKILDFEPHNALFVSDNNPLLFYTKIAKLAIKSLNNNGKLYFEINQLFAAEIFDFMHELGFVDIELKKDINGKKRMIRGTKN